jgi:uncharacterized protein YukE
MSERLVFELQAIDRATAPLKAVQAQVTRTAATINTANSSMRGFAQASGLANTATQKWAKGALQQAGFQIGDFAVQVANGTNGLQAFGQQAPQLLQIFGPAGAVIGAVVAVVAALGVVAQKSGSEIENLGSALGVLQAPLGAVADAVKQAGAALGSVFGNLSGEIDTAIIAVGLFAGAMAIRAVPAMLAATGASGLFASAMVTFRAAVVASAISAGSFSSALIFLRATAMTVGAAFAAVGAILMKLLPVALLVGLAKLIEIFLRLKEGAGGFGEAMKLLGDLVGAVWQGMVDSAKAIPDALSGVWMTIKAGFTSMVSGLVGTWYSFLETIARSSGEAGLDDVNSAVLGSLSSVGRLQNDLDKASETARGEASTAFASAGTKISSAWGGVTEAFGALNDAVAAGTTEVNIFGDASAEAADKAGGAAKAATEELTQQQENMKAIANTIRESFSSAFMSMVDGTKSVKDAFRDMARNIIMKLYEVLVVQRLVNGIMGVVGKAFPALAPAIAGFKAMGGPVTGGQAYMVGERGPELVVPSRNAQVIPNNQLGGGGVTVVQNINVSTGVQQTVRAEIKSLMPQIADSAKAAVLDAKRRGGAYGGAFA